MSWLAEQLRELGWTQAELARRSGVGQAQISRVLSGENRPGLDFLLAVAPALRVSVYELMELAGYVPPGKGITPRMRDALRRLSKLSEGSQSGVMAVLEAALEAFELLEQVRQ